MQKAYINALYELMQKDCRVCSLLSDSGTDYDAMVAREFPEQCFNFGIAEQNQVGIASGMAACGMLPFVYTTGAFLAYRAYEFIRDDVCFQNRNVKIVGMGSGLAWGTLGASHHTTEDVSALRALPNLTLLSPASPLEVEMCVRAAYELQGPVYIRIGMSGEKELLAPDAPFAIGKNRTLREGEDIAIFSTGSIAAEALEAADALKEKGVDAAVIDVCSLKPFDADGLLQIARRARPLFTVEEHNVAGGLGGIVSEALSQAGVSPTLHRIGLPDCFAKGYGTLAQVRAQNGLHAAGIAARILAILKRE